MIKNWKRGRIGVKNAPPQWVITVTKVRGVHLDGVPYKFRATIDSEPRLFGVGNSIPEAVNGLMEELADLIPDNEICPPMNGR